MDYRSAYIRRSRKGSRLKQRVAAIALAGVAGCAVLFALEMQDSPASAPAAQGQGQAAADTATLAPAVMRIAAQVETKKTRRVYPYSIVPGGVLNRQELSHAVVVDKVVAAHYAAFETGKATVETVRKPRAVYVSYRKGDKVFWTSKKLQLAEGETLLSDGQNEIRTRCGNRISDVPRQPVEAKGPSGEELDSSVEVAQEDGGNVEQVGFAVDGNPAGGSYQLKTFATGDIASTGGASPAPGNTGVPGYSINRDAIWEGGTLPVTQDSKTSSNTGSTGTSTGGSETGTSGTGGTTGTSSGGSGTGDPGTGGTSGTTGGSTTPGGTTPDGGTTQPTTDTGTKPSPLPGTLLPPTTDVPRQTNDPKPPTKHADVPEPGTLWLGGAGVAALLAARRAKKRARD
jgi:hypothetical protein